MLAEMLEMLGPDAGADADRLLADVVGLGRCYWQMLADGAGLADVVGRMVQRLK